jgi:hypothetical protein
MQFQRRLNFSGRIHNYLLIFNLIQDHYTLRAANISKINFNFENIVHTFTYFQKLKFVSLNNNLIIQ